MYSVNNLDKALRLTCAAVGIIFLTNCATPPEPRPAADPATAYGNQLGAIKYTVKPGDNLVLIAADITRERENWRLIAEFNQISNPASLRVGQTIYVPNDLIPLGANSEGSRQVVGQPGAVVNSITPRPDLQSKPLPSE